MTGRLLRCCLIALVGTALMTGCFPRLPTNQAAQQPAATDASFSPDGSEILFAANHDGDLEIFVVNADGSSPTTAGRISFRAGRRTARPSCSAPIAAGPWSSF